MKNTTFGPAVRARRHEIGLGLREFCRQIGYDPANWSKIERGQARVPYGIDRLKLGRVLKLDEIEVAKLVFGDKWEENSAKRQYDLGFANGKEVGILHGLIIATAISIITALVVLIFM